MKLKKIYKILKKRIFDDFTEEVYNHSDNGYILLTEDKRMESPIIKIKVFKDNMNVDINWKRNIGDYANKSQRTNSVKWNFLFKDKKELIYIVEVVTNSIIIKEHANGHSGFRLPSYIERYHKKNMYDI